MTYTPEKGDLPQIVEPVEEIDPAQAETIEAESGHGPQETIKRVQGTGELADLNNKALNTVLEEWRQERNNGVGQKPETEEGAAEDPHSSETPQN